MTERFLVTVSLGPVQSLIGAARRTRDLWCGSWLLSEAARAAARALYDAPPGCLIFPCPENPDTDLLPQDRPGDAANMANILRAVVTLETPEDARLLCERAKNAAAARLVELGEKARKKLDAPLREDVWQAQIDDMLETFSAWVSLAGCGDDYGAAGKRLGEALAARKATRDFRACPPLSAAASGLPKSSLDGALETVLPRSLGNGPQRRLQLSAGEQLDALGVIKRMAGEAEQFTSIMRIAADPWVRRLTADQQQRLRAAWEPLVGSDLSTRTLGNQGAYRALPYDGSLLYDFRLRNALDRKGLSEDERAALKRLDRCIKEIAREKATDGEAVGGPVPYAVILKADGDHMGKLLECATNAHESRRISRSLHGFASSVREIVRNHRGHAVYAGGDDVLALLPLATAVACAEELSKAFETGLGGVASELTTPAEDRPTLSVGLGIGHVMEPMGALRDRAERAEKLAKGADKPASRNALAILLRIRSGAELEWRAQWSDYDAFGALHRFTEAYRAQQLPSRAAYDLRTIDRRLAWLRDDGNDHARGMREAELHRLLEKARLPGGERRIPSDLQQTIETRAGKQSLRRLADSMIIARWLSARTAGDVGKAA